MAEKKPPRTMSAPFVAPGPSGVAVRDRLRVSTAEEAVLTQVGAHMGSLAARDLAVRCRDGMSHDKDTWAARKRDLTGASSSRCTVTFPHRGDEWRDRIETNAAVAYTIHHDSARGRWYITAAWQRRDVAVLPLVAALAAGCIGVDTNDDHLAAWRLDQHGNPVGEPRRFDYDLSGTADHRDAQIRHALTRLLRWARQTSVGAIAVEDLDFADGKTREKHGRKKRFRQLISRFPTGRLRARLVSMAAEAGIAVVAVDPAYTSRWGAQHWQKPTGSPTHKTTRHEAASLVIGRRAQGYPARRRTPPPRHDQSDRAGHRSIQARPGNPVREETRPTRTGPRTRSVHPPGM